MDAEALEGPRSSRQGPSLAGHSPCRQEKGSGWDGDRLGPVFLFSEEVAFPLRNSGTACRKTWGGGGAEHRKGQLSSQV